MINLQIIRNTLFKDYLTKFIMDTFLSRKIHKKDKIEELTMIDLENYTSNLDDSFTQTKEYEVENIIDRKSIGKKRLYLVKWKGFSENEATWEPRSNLSNLGKLLDIYDRRFDSRGFKKQIDKNNNYICKGSPDIDNKIQSKKPSFLVTNNHKLKFMNTHPFNEISQEKTLESIAFKVNNMDESKNNSLYGNNLKTSQHTNNYSIKSIENPKGSIEYDIPYKIIGYQNNESELKFFVSWKSREDNSVPEPSYLTENKLKKDHPSLLFDYYADCFKKLIKIESILIRDKE